MPDVDQKQRKMLLEQNCDKTEQTKYLKPLSIDEMDIRREQLTENAIKLSEIEDEKKEITKEFKDKTEPLVSANKILLQELKTRQTQVDGVLYYMADHENGMMEVYDENGEMISSRRLRPDEKQGTIFKLGKTANQ